MAAQIVFNDGGGPVVGSLISPATDVDVAVTASNFDDTGVLGWKWEFLDTPILSSNLRPIPVDTFLSTVGFTPDVVGHSVLIQLTTYTDVARTIVDGTDQKIMALKFPLPYDWRIPAAGETIEADMLRGWAEDVNKQLRETHAFISEHGTIVAGTINLFLRQTGGSDLNDGRTSGTAVQTMPALIALVKLHIMSGARVVVQMGDGNYPSPNFGTRALGDKLVLYGNGAGVGDGFNRLQTSETADTGTDATEVKKIGGGLTPDAVRGKTIRLLTGPGSPQRKTIRRNTVDGFLPSQAFSPPPDDTTTYEIVESTVELAYSGNFTSTIELSGAGPVQTQDAADGDVPAYCVFQVRLDATDNPVPNINNATVCYYGIEIGGSGTFWPAWNNASVFIGTDSIVGQFAFVPETLGFAASNTEWAGWGIGQVGANAVQWSPSNTTVRGYTVAARLFAGGSSVTWFMHGGRLFGVAGLDTLESGGATIIAEGGASAPVEIESSGAGNAVEASGQNARIRLVNAELTSAAALVRAKHGAQITVFSSVTGTSSGAEAVDATLQGKVNLSGAPVLEGATPAVAYNPGDGAAGQISDFGSVGDYLAALDGSVIERVS